MAARMGYSIFAGHSGSSEEGKRGEIQLNEREKLTIADLRFALKKRSLKGYS